MIVLLGSARSDGKTYEAIRHVFEGKDYEFVDLGQRRIAPYSYSGAYPDGDEFLFVAQTMAKHSAIIFATPVYWYAMSGEMKTFFDRLSDLITAHKPIGRSLAGRNGYVLATGTDEKLPDGFVVPFERTCDYFAIKYGGCSYVYTGAEAEIRRSSLARSKIFLDDAGEPGHA